LLAAVVAALVSAMLQAVHAALLPAVVVAAAAARCQGVRLAAVRENRASTGVDLASIDRVVPAASCIPLRRS
jgi:hypothetical protein